MKLMLKKIASLTLSLFIIATMFSCSILESHADTGKVTSSSITSTNWMAYLPNTASIGAINIPATHDSGCTDFLEADLISSGILKPLAKTQDLNFKEQLEAGIREFDIRISRPKALAGYTNDLVLNHGGICALRPEGDLKWLTLDDVVRYCRNFLKKHPTETCILRWNSEEGGAMDIDEDGRYGALVKEFTDDLKAHGDIVLELNDALPTVGEARGKIVAFETHIMKKDDIAYEGITGQEKWEGGKRYKKDEYFEGIGYYFDRAEKQNYVDDIHLIGDNKSDGLQFIGTDMYLMSLVGIPVDRKDPMAAPYVNKRLLEYNYKKGYYYGWISMDFATKQLAKVIYMSNIFDFDENGGSISYISDIGFAYDQDIHYSKTILEQNGFTTFDENFNAEGPDKVFSDAVVNGRRNKGSFNIAVGYKTTTDPMKAITGLKWLYIPVGEQKPSASANAFVNQGNYKQVQSVSSFDYPGSSGISFTNYELCSFNIGTKGFKVNLYYSKDQAEGERLYDLQSLEMLNKSMSGTFESQYMDSEAKDRLNNGYRTPRDENNNIFASNYGRNLQDDVYLFYKKAFPSSIPSKNADKEYKTLGTVSEEYAEYGMGPGIGFSDSVSCYLIKHTKPKIFSVTKSKGKNRLVFKNSKWDTVNNKQITNYQIYRSTSKKFNKNLKKITINLKKTSKSKRSYIDKNGNKKYYYKIRGIVKISGKKYYTKWSNIK